MDQDLRVTLSQYQETLPDGHPLKEIAQRTIVELGRKNPFNRYKSNDNLIRNIKAKMLSGGREFYSLENACNVLNLPESLIKYEINQILKKHGLRMV